MSNRAKILGEFKNEFEKLKSVMSNFKTINREYKQLSKEDAEWVESKCKPIMEEIDRIMGDEDLPFNN